MRKHPLWVGHLSAFLLSVLDLMQAICIWGLVASVGTGESYGVLLAPIGILLFGYIKYLAMGAAES